jgi:hypothetical protein
MNESGHDTREAFPAGSGDVPPGIGFPRGAREQGTATRRRYWRRRTQLLVAAAATVAATAGGVTAALLMASVNGALPPLAAVTSALAKTSAESYSFSLDSTAQLAGRQVHSDMVSGTFDPRHELGEELLTTTEGKSPVKAQIRFIGKYVYTWESRASGLGKPWNKSPIPRPGAGAQVIGAYGFVSDRPVSPTELSGALLSAGTVRDAGPASGPGWTGTKYTFTTRLLSGGSVSGTVYVDQQGRVRRLVTITMEGRMTVAMDRDLTFGDFGAPVPVTAPAASQVKYTSTPWWGSYF